MRFPYRFFRSHYYPIIPVTIVKNSKRVNTSAVVDSGAVLSIFNSSIARPIGLDIEAGEKRIFQGASAKLVGYVHNITMIVAGREFGCKVAFSDELGTSFNLLGRETVFDKFIVAFNEKIRELTMDPS